VYVNGVLHRNTRRLHAQANQWNYAGCRRYEQLGAKRHQIMFARGASPAEWTVPPPLFLHGDNRTTARTPGSIPSARLRSEQNLWVGGQICLISIS